MVFVFQNLYCLFSVSVCATPSLTHHRLKWLASILMRSETDRVLAEPPPLPPLPLDFSYKLNYSHTGLSTLWTEKREDQLRKIIQRARPQTMVFFVVCVFTQPGHHLWMTGKNTCSYKKVHSLCTHSHTRLFLLLLLQFVVVVYKTLPNHSLSPVTGITVVVVVATTDAICIG
jgi:hypothetical protein